MSIRLDLEDGPPDPLDILGEFVISDGLSTIEVHATFVDVWIVALIAALQKLQSADHVVVEGEEPIPLRVDMDSEGSLLISDGDGAVVARTRNELHVALMDVAGELLNAMSDIPGTDRNPDLALIDRFYRTHFK